MFKITTSGTNIQKVIDAFEPQQFLFDKGILYVLLNMELKGLLQKIENKRISNIFIEEIDESNFTMQSDIIQQEFKNMQIRNDCIRFEDEQQEQLKSIKEKLVNLQHLLEKRGKEGTSEQWQKTSKK